MKKKPSDSVKRSRAHILAFSLQKNAIGCVCVHLEHLYIVVLGT